jgi:hypothetical protein
MPLYPWNDVAKYTRKELVLETAVNGITMGLAVICLFSNKPGFSHHYPLVFFPLLLLGEALSWWVPFVFPSERHRKLYDSHFSRTFKFFSVAGKPTPDANHVVLHLLTVFSAIVVYVQRLGVS